MSDPVSERATPFWCRLGAHQWYLDSAIVASADRCGRCGKYRNEADGEELERARTLFVAGPQGESFPDAMRRVSAALFDRTVNGQPIIPLTGPDPSV